MSVTCRAGRRRNRRNARSRYLDSVQDGALSFRETGLLPFMNLDDDICYCYHVPMRKLLNFARREQPVRASQMSNCLGAGTGCGWCIPILRKIHEQVCMEQRGQTESGQEGAPPPEIGGLPDRAADYGEARRKYLESGRKHQF